MTTELDVEGHTRREHFSCEENFYCEENDYTCVDGYVCDQCTYEADEPVWWPCPNREEELA